MNSFLDRFDKDFVRGLIALAMIGGCAIYPAVMGLALNPAITGFVGLVIGFYFGK